ncbi:MAG: redoxin domain-containing protein [Crocinitomicaceae bacterium]|nr:redoxin domain-containing protein [Crocinitomicaceae bacterium]
MKIVVGLAMVVGMFGTALAQKIEVRMTGMTDTVYLAKYRGKQLLYADTVVSKAGKAIFDTKRLGDYQPGMMAFLTKDNKGFFQFIYNFEDIIIEATLENAMQNAKVIKSEENKQFYEYLGKIAEYKEKAKPISMEIQKEQDEAKKKELEKKRDDLNEEVRQFQLDFAEKNKEKLVGALIKMSVDIKIPDAPEGAAEDWQYQWYINHYWDHCNLKMPGIQNSEILHAKMEYYFGDKLLLVPDSINKYADLLIDKCDEGTETFRYLVNYITSNYERSKILGMDAVFVHMATNYYCEPNAKAFWMSKEQLAKLCERREKWAPLIPGAKAPYLKLPDSTEKNWVAFYDLDAEYKILYFWDPDCGHCKKATPKLQTLYEKKFKKRNIEVYAIGKAQGEDFDKWKKYIRENNLQFYNVGLTKTVFEKATGNDGAGQFIVHFLEKGVSTEESLKRLNQSMNYTTTYDIFSTPRVFVLDKDNKIVAKSLSIAQLEEFLDRKQGKENEPKIFKIEDEKPEDKMDH